MSDSPVPQMPDHPDARRLAAAMRRLDTYSETGANPFDSVSTWVDPRAVLREAERVRESRAQGEKQKPQRPGGRSKPRSADFGRIHAAGTSAFMFGYAVGCLIRDPDAPLGAGPCTVASSDDEPIGRDPQTKMAELESVMSTVLAITTARDSLSSAMSAVNDVESWQRSVSAHVDPSCLEAASVQVAMRLNRITTAGDLLRVQTHPQGAQSLRECVGMFIDGFLYATHLPAAVFLHSAARRSDV